MASARRIAIFVCSVAIVYAALLWAWSIIGPGYASAFRAVSTLMYSDMGAYGTVRFSPLAQPDAHRDTTVVLRNYSDRKEGQFEISSRFIGYLPTAMLSALVICTPIPLRRRLTGLAAGLALVHLFIALRMWVVLLWAFGDPRSVAMYHPGPVGRGILEFLIEVLYVSLTGAFVAPIIIWMIICFRRRNRQLLIGADARREQP